MKRYMILHAMLVGSLLVSCSANKQVASSQDSRTEPTKDTYEAYAENVGISETETENAKNMSGSSGAVNNPNAKATAFDNDGFDYDRMFEDLKMNDDQIRQFTMGMEKFQSKKVSSPIGEMMGTTEDERDRQLENILTEEQLELYRSKQ